MTTTIQKSYTIWRRLGLFGALALAALVVWDRESKLARGSAAATPVTTGRRLTTTTTQITNMVTVHGYLQSHPIARKQLQDLEHVLATDSMGLDLQFRTLSDQREFVQSHCTAGNDADNTALQQFDALLNAKLEHLAVELYKWCALSSSLQASKQQQQGAVYVDSSSPLLQRLQAVLQEHSISNIAILGDGYFTQTIHGSLIMLRPSQASIAKQMLSLLVDTPEPILQTSPLLIPRTLYALIAVDAQQTSLTAGANGDAWFLLEQTCHMDPLSRSLSSSQSHWTDANSHRVAHHCPDKDGFCCFIQNTETHQTVLLSRHPLFPYQVIPDDALLPRPYNAEAGHYSLDDVPFISTIREQVFERPSNAPETPNFFDVLLRNDCLPSSDTCNKCLRNKAGADCTKCAKDCECYCKTLCREMPEPKHVAKQLVVTPPLYSRNPNRIIPRIVHQTWFEPLSKQKYPNMSRLVESFRQSGWEYKFWSDAEAQNFLSTHMPAEIREAYDALKPGAFKADLFRYCVLLIHGGVYADVDILLESSLDLSIPPDVGFMVPTDEPGMPVNKRMCLWNGFIASVPAHPYLIKAIETVVNQVRNRFTSVDNDATFCPNPELSILHAFDTLFTAGPCLLGASINRVLGRPPQTAFSTGELDPWTDQQAPITKTGISFVQGTDDESKIPGRTIILHQNKWDMGAHRFTLLEKNLVVAATDLPDSNDREKLESKSTGNGGGEHYSKTHAKTGIYGLENLYVDKRKADEDLVFVLDASHKSQIKVDAVTA